jgi:hypothetical protein
MRDLFVIGGISVSAIAIGALLFFFGPTSLQLDISTALSSAATGSVPYMTLAKGNRAVSIADRTNYRITTSDDFTALWGMVYGEKDAPALPTVDFSKYEVLALFDGSHAGTGYDIQPASVADANATRSVTIDHVVPDPKCQVTNKATNPFVILQVPKTLYSLAHKDVIMVSPCQ